MNGQTNSLLFSDYAMHAVVFGVVIVSWFAFALVFLLFLRRKPPTGAERRRDGGSTLGLALQGAGYAFVWAFMRQKFTHIAPLGKLLDIAVAVLTVASVVGSVWLMRSAFATLGKQWSLTARVLEGHKLITAETYGWVRHPIYTGMFGMLLATGLAASHWLGLLAGAFVFWAGTMIRVRSEERLLRAAFGAQYDEYARRVPAVLPGIY
jgi:protein-S-isoprenylcysteine O-methyltransferase Ste14